MSEPIVPTQGRAQRVLHWLAKQKVPRTVPEIIAATDPGCSSQNMHGSVVQLIKAGKLKRKKTATGRPGLVATKMALVDRRARRVAPSKPSRKQREPRQAQVRSDVATALTATVVAPTTSAPVAATARPRTSLSVLFTTVAAKRIERDELASDVDRFLAKGGQIQKLGWGESSASLAAKEQQYLEQRRRGREAQQARREKRTTA